MKTTIIDSYQHFGKCLSLEEGKLTLYVTLDRGPRIIYASFDGSDNIFYNEPEGGYTVTDEMHQSVFGVGTGWQICGGHRFWISPEVYPYTYYPDNDPVKFEIKGNSVQCMPSVQRVTGLQTIWNLTFASKGLALTHTVKNCSNRPVQCAVWALSVMAPGSVAKVPQSRDASNPFVPNRCMSFWPYSNLADPRYHMEPDAFVLRHDGTVPGKFKVGMMNTAGYIAISVNGVLFTKGFLPKHPTAAYPDFGVSTELYTDERFLEAETLGPLTDLHPGESTHHTEYWAFAEMGGSV
ncbi:MAG TPA: hypothetical protein DCY75_04045 [Clostridiales bacterium]|nr:hypothetical protein [Clostridiales bacterium]